MRRKAGYIQLAALIIEAHKGYTHWVCCVKQAFKLVGSMLKVTLQISPML